MSDQQTISWHVYDLDISRAFQNIKAEVERGNYVFKKNPGLTGQGYIDNMETFVRVHCNIRGLDPKDYIQGTKPLLPENDDMAYENILGFCLLAYDYHRIPFLLDYQKAKYPKNYSLSKPFLNLLEFLTYSYVKENSAFNLDARLQKICEWILKEREKGKCCSKENHSSLIQKETIIDISVNDVRKEKETDPMKSFDYKKVLDMLWRTGVAMENDPSKYKGLSENKLRDNLIWSLLVGYNFVVENYVTTAESQKKIGRTDIQLKHPDGTVLFVGECKVWRRKGLVHNEINEFLRKYVSSRDTFTALIYFVKDGGITGVFDQLCLQFANHPLKSKVGGSLRQFRKSHNFFLKDDKKAKINLELMAFDFPRGKKKTAKKVVKKSKTNKNKREVKRKS